MSNRILHRALLMFVLTPALGWADDFAYWGGYSFTGPIAEHVDFLVRPEIRLDRNASRFYFFELQTGPTWHAHPHWDFSLKSNFVRVRRTEATMNTQVWLQPEITPLWTLFGLPMSLRNRFEFRFGQQASDRYRANLTATAPRGFTPFKIKPYLSNEFFYDWGQGRHNENRASIGLRFPIDRRTHLTLYGLYRTYQATGRWRAVEVFGSRFEIRFGSPS